MLNGQNDRWRDRFEYRGNIKSHYNLFPVDRKIWFSMLFCRTLQLHRMTTREWTKTKYKCARCIFRWRSTTGYRIFVLRPSERGLVSRPRIFAGKKPAFLRKLKARGYFRWRMWRCSLRKWPFLSKPPVRTRGRPLNDRYAVPRSCIQGDDAIQGCVKCIIQNAWCYFGYVVLENIKIRTLVTEYRFTKNLLL